MWLEHSGQERKCGRGIWSWNTAQTIWDQALVVLGGTDFNEGAGRAVRSYCDAAGKWHTLRWRREQLNWGQWVTFRIYRVAEMKRLNGCSEVKCDEGQESRLTLRYLSKWKDKISICWYGEIGGGQVEGSAGRLWESGIWFQTWVSSQTWERPVRQINIEFWSLGKYMGWM